MSHLISRFKEGMGLSSEEVAAFQDYFYHITAAKGSGEFALAYLLGPFAWARHPLEGRLQELKARLCLPRAVLLAQRHA